MSNPSQPHGLQHSRATWPSPSPRVCPSSYPLNWWCYPTISSSNALFSFCFPSLRVFFSESARCIRWPNIGASASASVLTVSSQDWFPLRLTGLIPLKFKGLSRVFSSTTVREHWFFSILPSLWSNCHIHTWLLSIQPWLYGSLLAKWCLCFLTHCLILS